MVNISFTHEKKIKAENQTILQAAQQAGIPLTHACGGNAECSTCRVSIDEGLEFCSIRTDKEAELATLRQFPDTIRLACQTSVTGDITCTRLIKDEEDMTLIDEEIATSHQGVGQARDVALYFSDLRGFTHFAEKLPPYDVVHILNKYFNRICPPIYEYKGEIDKYMGDGIMAIFGCTKDPNATLSAIKCALIQLKALDEFNVHLKKNYDVSLKMGIGIHYGRVIVGNIGYRQKIQFTAIGDAVNMAARIESANKEAGTCLLISQTAYDKVKDKVVIGTIHDLHLKGKSGSYKLYEVVSAQ